MLSMAQGLAHPSKPCLRRLANGYCDVVSFCSPGYFRLYRRWPPKERCELYFDAIVGFTQPFFITPCDGRKLR